VTVLSTEKSGSAEFEFEYGADFASHIAAFKPTFAKALVRFNPESDAEVNRRQTARLKQLSDYCRAVRQSFMIELLVPPTAAQLAQAHGFQTTFDLLTRPALMLQAIRTLQDAGVEPDVWKIQGLDRRSDCEHIVATARRNGRTKVGCIVLGLFQAIKPPVRPLRDAAPAEEPQSPVGGLFGMRGGGPIRWATGEELGESIATAGFLLGMGVVLIVLGTIVDGRRALV